VKKHYILPVFLPFAGCTGKCVYCDQAAITGLGEEDILSSAARQINVWKLRRKEWNELAYYGGSFAGLNKDVRQELYALAKPYPVRISTSPDSVTDDFIKETGRFIRTLELGIQSLSDDVLKKNGRKYTADYAISLLKRLKGVGCETAAQFMTGLYGETREEFIKTCGRVKELAADYARIYPTLVFPGSPLAKITDFVPLAPAESILRTAWLYIILTSSGIKVIRIALPQGGAEEGEGFRHRAFGDLVKTVTCYAYFVKQGVLLAGFGGYRGALGKLNGKSSPADFGKAARALASLYSAEEWLNDMDLKRFIETLL
jgi:histone acetyltransferase (RNA polymerase elongator complex component)